MLEVFTIGGGEYIVNVLNAVAAWCGGGGYRSMLQVVFVMGLTYSLFIVAFSLDWRAWFNWFLISTLVYLMLMVPTVTIKVTDRIDPGLAPAAVANVPLGLGVMASFTSQLGDWMTRTAETVFVMPNALALSNNGMIYGARLLEKAQTFQITDAVFRANLDEHLKQCTFYDVLLGFKSMDDLTRTNNLWAAIGRGSVSRAQKWISKTGAGTTESSIIPCNEAYQRMDVQWADAFNKDILPFAKNAYPKLADTVAAQKLRDDLPQVAAAMHGTSSDAYSYLKQVSTIDSFLAARESFSDAGWDAYAAQRADAQTRNTYTSIAQQAMTWVPLLGIVLTVVFYAMFPVLFPLFLFPRTGISTLKGYATGFFYLASWGPLYVILHMFVMSRAANSFHALAPNGPTLLVADGITSVNNDISTVAGFLMMSVPFLAAGMAKGAMSIAGQGTSMLAPAQNAAEAAAAERTTGNYSYGNTSFANLTSNMQQSNKWDSAPMHTSGFARSTFVNEDGGLTTNFADGSSSFDTRGAISSLAFTPTRSASFGNEARHALSEGESRVNQVRHAASESWSSTASTANDLMRSAETRASSSTENGSATNYSISKMNDVSRSLSHNLQNRFGLSQSDADTVARSSTTTGEANAGLSALKTIWGIKGEAGVGLRLASIAQRSTGRTVSGDQAYNDLREYVSRESNSTQARTAREDFQRQISTSGDSRVRSLSEKLGVSLNESRSASREAVQSEEAYSRISRDISNSESRGFSLNQNETQEFVTFAQEELMKPENAIVASTGWTPGMARPRSEEQRQARDIMLEKFMSDRMTHMREDLGLEVPKTLGHTLAGPSIATEAGVRAWGGRNADALAGQGPDAHVRQYSANAALAGEVSNRIEDGSARISNGAFEIGNAVDNSRETVVGLGEAVGTRNEQNVIRTMPVVSPLMDSVDRGIDRVERGVADAGAWIDNHFGQGRSHITPVTAGQKPHLPVSGTITSGMGGRVDPLTGHVGQHRGIDIAATAGTVIRAPAAGTVVKRDFEENGAGNYVVLQHADGSESKYFHLQSGSTLVAGTSVRAGAVLGRIGSTGHSTGPHLHYELWKDGRALNPQRFTLNE